MVKIFAKKGTDEKVLALCDRDQVGTIMSYLNVNYGGDWVWVDKLLPDGEILHFNDGLEYNGYHGKDERYCKFIKKLK